MMMKIYKKNHNNLIFLWKRWRDDDYILYLICVASGVLVCWQSVSWKEMKTRQISIFHFKCAFKKGFKKSYSFIVQRSYPDGICGDGEGNHNLLYPCSINIILFRCDSARNKNQLTYCMERKEEGCLAFRDKIMFVWILLVLVKRYE